MDCSKEESAYRIKLICYEWEGMEGEDSGICLFACIDPIWVDIDRLREIVDCRLQETKLN